MPAKPGDIKAAVFVIHGSKDPVAPKADRDALEAEMDGVGANWQTARLRRTAAFVRRRRDDDEGRRRISRRRRASDVSGCSTTSSRTRSTGSFEGSAIAGPARWGSGGAVTAGPVAPNSVIPPREGRVAREASRVGRWCRTQTDALVAPLPTRPLATRGTLPSRGGMAPPVSLGLQQNLADHFARLDHLVGAAGVLQRQARVDQRADRAGRELAR